ncbi:hypothetical protein Tco_0564404 [Tanacetum coccineum]
MFEKKVNTTPVDYAALNQLYKDFETRFVPQTKLSAEQAFWPQNLVNSPELILSSRPTIIEVPKELPKVSMVNTSLKKLKHHLAGFDVVVKERTTPTAITEGSWGFEHTKACFRDEIIPFVKALKDLFNTFNQYLVDELSEVQNIFHQIEQAVEQHPQSQDKDTVIKKLKERIKSLSGKQNEDKIKQDLEEIETINIELDHRVTKLIAENEHLKQTYKQLYDSIKPARIRSKEHCDDLINQVNLKSVEISNLNASLQEKVLVITALEDDLRKLKGKALVDNDVTKHHSDLEILKIDVEPITPKLLNKQTAHSAYIKHTQEEATVLRDLVEHVKSKYPLDQSLESACRYAKLVQELLTNISKTCHSINNADGKLVAVTPKNKDKSIIPPRKAPRTRTTPATTTTTTSVTNAQLQAMIDQGVTAALAARDANRNGDDSHTSGTGVRRTERVARECTYQDFMKCQPLYFKGTEGVVELTQWFERMETVFRISHCSVENQGDIKFYFMSKDEMKKLEAELWNLKVKGTDVIGYNQRFQELALLCVRMFPEESDKVESTLAERQAENKRKLDNNNQAQQQSPKRQNVAQAYAAGTGERKEYAGTLPLCNRSDCPELKNQNHGNQAEGNGARGMVYAFGGGEIPDNEH